ncbi:hypothetical protein FA15DRAFT_605990 [Coprinopsis marcescibilis]|uniref:Uncharacterized protein n=1 Tax=Coprinopsis marcescibilis TaxID=230819 RepID=A0A5C3KAS6_COPMA|nr:hypothetical protein FA15DRAFT_605990 [Coprinopsis marcescibilis]
MGLLAADRPKGTTFYGARRHTLGSITFHLNSVAAASWVGTPDVLMSFLSHFDASATGMTHTYHTTAQFIPTTFDLSIQAALAEVEASGGLKPVSIRYVRFFKPVEQQARGQRYTHATIAFADPGSANIAISQGLFFDGQQVQVKKTLPEPRRCLKCQCLGANHVAAQCKSIHDVCAWCVSMHRTSECDMGPGQDLRCSNCKPHEAWGHGVADRQCPTFLEKQAQLQCRLPETKYRFFPTDDPRTWADANGEDSSRMDADKMWRVGAERVGRMVQGGRDGDGQYWRAGGMD